MMRIKQEINHCNNVLKENKGNKKGTKTGSERNTEGKSVY